VHVQQWKTLWISDPPDPRTSQERALATRLHWEAGLAARAARQAETKILMVSNQVKTSNKEEDSDSIYGQSGLLFTNVMVSKKNPLGSTKVYPFWPGCCPNILCADYLPSSKAP